MQHPKKALVDAAAGSSSSAADDECVITGINALYHKFTTLKSQAEWNMSTIYVSSESLVASVNNSGNADDLHAKHFPVQTCTETDERTNLKISIDQLAGAFGLVLLVLLYGIIHHFCGKGTYVRLGWTARGARFGL